MISEDEIRQEAAENLINLQLLGVQIVSQTEDGSFPNLRFVVKFSVPEKVELDKQSILDATGEKIEWSTLTREDLIKEVKRAYLKMADPEGLFDENDESLNSYFHFLCKTRHEVWDTEKFIAEYTSLKAQFKKLEDLISGFSEV